MRLTFRPAVPADLKPMLRVFFAHADPSVWAAVTHEWRVFLANPATLTMMVEDQARSEDDRLVGFAQTVFVTDALVQHLRSHVGPYANQHASQRLPGGSWPLLSPDELKKANAADGVNALVNHWAWRSADIDPDDQRIIREYVDQEYTLFYRGYRFKEVLIAAVDEWPYGSLLHAGFRMVDDYEAWYAAHSPPPEHRPYLVGLTREEALASEGSHASRIFAYSEPRLHLRPVYQELLFHALLSRTDEEIALLLEISLDGVKKRWKAVFRYITDTAPALLPEGEGSVRGPEKRRVLLEYVREHPEELRPTLLRHPRAFWDPGLRLSSNISSKRRRS